MKDLTEILTKISDAESQLTILLGNSIWGYANILDEKRENYTLIINSLNEDQKKALREYIEAVNLLLVESELTEVIIASDNSYSELDNFTNAFIEASSMLYSLRYAWAIKEFSSYQLIRVYTWLETEMLKKGNMQDHPDTAITIAIPLAEAIQLTDNGNFDLQKTANTEAENHFIKTFLSFSTHTKVIQNKLYQDMLDFSSYGMIPRLFEDEIQKMTAEIARILVIEPTSMVYRYLARGYTLSQSIQNVSNYYQNVIKSQNEKLSPTFSELELNLTEAINASLEKIPNLKEETKATYLNETIIQSISILKSKILLPINYYQLNFRKANPSYISEKYYDFVVDSFVYDGNRVMNEYPIETYAIELTDNAKEQIFASVTNGNINPDYSLNHYLRFKPFDLKTR